ncbi:MAG: glycosyltransferase [bacterium]
MRTPEPDQVGSSARMALVHDWLTGMRGGEKCLKIFCEMFPRADVFTLFQVSGAAEPAVAARVAGRSFLQALPGLGRYYRYLLPLFPAAVEGLDLTGYDPVVSISHCVAKGAIAAPGGRHVCYCLTPMRYCWDLFPLYFGRPDRGGLRRFPAGLVAHYLRLWDVAASNRVDTFVAVSKFVAARIRKFYRRTATVIYPPVDAALYQPSAAPRGDYYLFVAAAAPNKRVDIALEAFSRLDRPLKIAGGLQGAGRLRPPRSRAGRIEWLGWVPDEDLADLYAHCRALVFPGIEDFGLVPVEAQAAGRPVIAYAGGGVLESVRGVEVSEALRMEPGAWRDGGFTGIFFRRPTADSLAEAVLGFEQVEGRFEPDRIRRWACRFDRGSFERSWRRVLAPRAARAAPV